MQWIFSHCVVHKIRVEACRLPPEEPYFARQSPDNLSPVNTLLFLSLKLRPGCEIIQKVESGSRRVSL